MPGERRTKRQERASEGKRQAAAPEKRTKRQQAATEQRTKRQQAATEQRTKRPATASAKGQPAPSEERTKRASEGEQQQPRSPQPRPKRQSEHRFGHRPEGEPVFVDDPAVLKALTDPLRHRIIGVLDEPMSAKEVAAILDVPATRLYYHLDLLVQRGLAKVADHRTVGRNVERLFVRAGDRFVLSEELSRLALLSDDTANQLQHGVNKHVANMLRAAEREARGDDGESGREAVAMVMDMAFRLSPARAHAFVDRLNEVIGEFVDGDGDDGGESDDGTTESYGLLVMLAPTTKSDKNDENDKIDDDRRSTR